MDTNKYLNALKRPNTTNILYCVIGVIVTLIVLVIFLFVLANIDIPRKLPKYMDGMYEVDDDYAQMADVDVGYLSILGDKALMFMSNTAGEFQRADFTIRADMKLYTPWDLLTDQCKFPVRITYPEDISSLLPERCHVTFDKTSGKIHFTSGEQSHGLFRKLSSAPSDDTSSSE